MSIYFNGTSYPLARLVIGEGHKPVLQDKSVSPSTAQQTIRADIGYDGLGSVTVREIQTETKSITENGTYSPRPGKLFSGVTVDVQSASGMNVQGYLGYATVSATSYTATDVKLTVAKTGTYKVSWTGWRNTNSGTSGSQLYIAGSAYGSANTSFQNTYGHAVNLTGVRLTEGQEIVVRARARSTSYVMAVGNLIIEQTA